MQNRLLSADKGKFPANNYQGNNCEWIKLTNINCATLKEWRRTVKSWAESQLPDSTKAIAIQFLIDVLTWYINKGD